MLKKGRKLGGGGVYLGIFIKKKAIFSSFFLAPSYSDF